MGSQLLQNAQIIKQTDVLLWKIWQKYGSVSYLFSCTAKGLFQYTKSLGLNCQKHVHIICESFLMGLWISGGFKTYTWKVEITKQSVKSSFCSSVEGQYIVHSSLLRIFFFNLYLKFNTENENLSISDKCFQGATVWNGLQQFVRASHYSRLISFLVALLTFDGQGSCALKKNPGGHP